MADATDPGAGAHLAAVDGALRETLERSLADRLSGQRGAEENLANAFWGDHPPPRDLGEALTWFGPTCVNMAVRLFERIRVLDPTLGVWGQIRYLRNGWYGGSAGFKVVYTDPAAMRARLDALFSGAGARCVARDTFFAGLEHQLSSPPVVVSRHLGSALRSLTGPGTGPGAPPDADTWREVDRLQQEALHFCLGKHEPRPVQLDDIHIDWSSPVVGVDPATQRCRYHPLLSVTHWAQAMFGLGKPVFPFERIDAQLASAVASPRREAFAARWREAKWGLSLRGRAGADEALRWLRECERLAKA